MDVAYLVNPACFARALSETGATLDPSAVAAVRERIADALDDLPPGVAMPRDPGHAPFPTVYGVIRAESYDWPHIAVDSSAEVEQPYADAADRLFATAQETASARLAAAGFTIS